MYIFKKKLNFMDFVLVWEHFKKKLYSNFRASPTKYQIFCPKTFSTVIFDMKKWRKMKNWQLIFCIVRQFFNIKIPKFVTMIIFFSIFNDLNWNTLWIFFSCRNVIENCNQITNCIYWIKLIKKSIMQKSGEKVKFTTLHLFSIIIRSFS